MKQNNPNTEGLSWTFKPYSQDHASTPNFANQYQTQNGDTWDSQTPLEAIRFGAGAAEGESEAPESEIATQPSDVNRQSQKQKHIEELYPQKTS